MKRCAKFGDGKITVPELLQRKSRAAAPIQPRNSSDVHYRPAIARTNRRRSRTSEYFWLDWEPQRGIPLRSSGT